jgi:anti-sigma factor RsiW
MSAHEPSDALLERYLAGALDEESRARVETLLADSAAARARLEELRADSAAFLLLHPPGPLVAHFKEERRRSWWQWSGDG